MNNSFLKNLFVCSKFKSPFMHVIGLTYFISQSPLKVVFKLSCKFQIYNKNKNPFNMCLLPLSCVLTSILTASFLKVLALFLFSLRKIGHHFYKTSCQFTRTAFHNMTISCLHFIRLITF